MDKINATFITLNGFVEISRYRYVYFTALCALYLLIVCSNATLVYLIWTHKNLHEPMYAFIAALLFNCLLYSTTVYPKLLADSLSEQQLVSHSACVSQFFMFYWVAASELLLLAAMAFDRYVSICKPLEYPLIMGKKTVAVLLLLAWILPACHMAAQAALIARANLCSLSVDGIFCNNTIYSLHCVKSQTLTVLGVVALLNFGILPLLFTVFTYAKIIIVSRKSCREFRRKSLETCMPHLLVLCSYFCLMAYDVIIARVESNFSKTARLIMTLQVLFYHPLLNPFIYGLKMKEISKHLRRLFRF